MKLLASAALMIAAAATVAALQPSPTPPPKKNPGADVDVRHVEPATEAVFEAVVISEFDVQCVSPGPTCTYTFGIEIEVEASEEEQISPMCGGLETAPNGQIVDVADSSCTRDGWLWSLTRTDGGDIQLIVTSSFNVRYCHTIQAMDIVTVVEGSDSYERYTGAVQFVASIKDCGY